MITSGEFPGLELPAIDAHSSLEGLGTVELHHPTQDLDGDGLLDTATAPGLDGSLEIWTDLDHDGYADHVAVVDPDGDYAAWEFHHYPDGTSAWVHTDQGKLDK